jgi:hypothetical protein
MRFLNTIFVIIGIIGLGIVIYILTRDYYKNFECPVNVKKELIGKKEEGNEQSLKKIFNNMFQNPSPWFGSFNIYNDNFRSLTDERIIGNKNQSYINGNI